MPSVSVTASVNAWPRATGAQDTARSTAKAARAPVTVDKGITAVMVPRARHKIHRRAVARAQRKLVKVRRVLRPVLNYQGA